MTLTIRGQDKYSTKVGGAATILVVLAVLLQTVYEFHALYTNPSYNQFPTTYDFAYSKKIDLDLRANMISYAFGSFKPEGAFRYLRIVFTDFNGDNIPAVLCKDYFAEEIEAEASGESNSTFYTQTYARSIK